MGNLYIVATPIGNLQDITLRAADILLNSKIVVAESASKAGILLKFLEEKFNKKRNPEQKIISMAEDEEENKIPSLIQALEGSDIALISEAGTPLISDPGFRLVREAIKRGVQTVPVPGASSPIAALSASGLPTNRFTFLGFLPKSQSKRKKELEKVRNLSSTLILFESPHRIVETLKDIQDVFGEIEIVIARELTKIHEEIIRLSINKVLMKFEEKPPKGELVVLFKAV